MRLLFADDEISLSRAVAKILEKNNFTVDCVYNGIDALEYARAGDYDVIILDIMMPKLDGIAALKEIRRDNASVPVIMLTAKSEIDDRVLGLDSGANDYITKPFDARELLARIRAVTRSKTSADSALTLGNVSLNRSTYELSSPFGCFRLANKEYQIMEMLMQNPRNLISTERFMDKIWGADSDAEINVVWVYISYLRKKLAALKADVQIKASRNVGYSLEVVA